MYKTIINVQTLSKFLDISYSLKLSVVIIEGFSGAIALQLSSYYFVFKNENSINFIFLKNFYYKSFLKHFLSFYSSRICSFFLKLRIKGLGYRIRSISEFIHYFFFNYTNFFYFYNPKNLLVKIYKKRMLLLSYDWQMLKLVLSHILLLKKTGPYRMQGLRLAKQILLLKKSGKKV